MKKTNPFKENSTSYHDFKIMSDLKWHCTKCELKSGQAKTWQVWRQEKWIQLDKNEKWNWFNNILCEKCWNKTVHRKLLSVEILDETKSRSWISPKIAKKVKDFYKNEEAFFLREFPVNQLEIDHKFPQIRWNKDESDNNKLSDEELKNKFILLSRSNNLLKSRKCEKCFETWERWIFPWIYFWYEWNEKWSEEIDKHDEKWCIWCFWHNPYKWREELNKKITNS